jgi:hypothetical protein
VITNAAVVIATGTTTAVKTATAATAPGKGWMNGQGPAEQESGADNSRNAHCWRELHVQQRQRESATPTGGGCISPV